jgi:hypothetical protein
MLDNVRGAQRRRDLRLRALALACDALRAHWDVVLTLTFVLCHRGWLERPTLDAFKVSRFFE